MSEQRILVVDDDRDSRSILTTVLTAAGFSVITAQDGQVALNLFDGGLVPALLVMDLRMPKVSGWQLLQHCGNDPRLRFVPVIVTTGVEPSEFQGVADAVFQKPVDYDRLVATARRLIKKTEHGHP